jgi:hypothetical protein
MKHNSCVTMHAERKDVAKKTSTAQYKLRQGAHIEKLNRCRLVAAEGMHPLLYVMCMQRAWILHCKMVTNE